MARAASALSLRKRLVFASLPVVTLVFVAEVLLRLTGAAERCPSYRGSILLTCDPILYFRPNPNQAIDGRRLINRAGFRGREFGPKQPGVYRIITLGDSCTFGIISPDQRNRLAYIREPYPQRLQAIAAERLGSDRVEVLNAAVPGYNSYQGLMLLRTKLRGLDPDLITVRFGWNDHLMSPERHIGNAFHEPATALGRGVQDLLLRTALYPFSQRLGMQVRLWLEGGDAAGPPLPARWEPNVPLPEYRHNLRRIVAIARERHSVVWLLTSPQAFVTADHQLEEHPFALTSAAQTLLRFNAIPSFERLIQIHEAYNDATRAVGKELGVPVVDMAAAYRGGSGLFSVGDVLHPTQAGHDLEAETLYQELVTSGLNGAAP
jgi:lysophospholipase L1-like esterase